MQPAEQSAAVAVAEELQHYLPLIGYVPGSPGAALGPGPGALARLAASARGHALDLVAAAASVLRWLDGRLCSRLRKSSSVTSHAAAPWTPPIGDTSRGGSEEIWPSLLPRLQPAPPGLPDRSHPVRRVLSTLAAPALSFPTADFLPPAPPPVLAAPSAERFPLGAYRSWSPAPPLRLPSRPPPLPSPLQLRRLLVPRRVPFLMTGRRRPPRRDVIVAAGPPAVPIQPAAQGGQVPALFRAVADCLTAGVGVAPSAPPMATARPREPVYRSPRGRTHPFLRARGQSSRRRRPPRTPLSGQARQRPQLHAPASQSSPLHLPPSPVQYASSQQVPPVAQAPAQSAPPVPLSRPSLPDPDPEATPQSQPSDPAAPSSRGASAPRLVKQAPLPSAAPVPGSEPPPLSPSHQPVVPSLSVPTPAVPYACSYPPRLDVTDSAPPGPRGLPFPDPAYCGPRRQHPLVPGSCPPGARFGFVSPGVDWDGCLSWPPEQDGGNWGSSAPPLSPPWGEPCYGQGDYESRWRHLQTIGRCVTELSFALDLLHDALLSREVVARDPQMNEDQQGRVRRAVESVLWDVLHLPLEPGDPSPDDGPGAAAFRMVATAAEECPLGIVPALACLLRWLGRRVRRM
ncbi:unnamed protein product [Closterium sp. NIES-65]|nr:unnamed protein product [Closterium sp. NIES-65]